MKEPIPPPMAAMISQIPRTSPMIVARSMIRLPHVLAPGEALVAPLCVPAVSEQ
jgi:hypothetical protein